MSRANARAGPTLLRGLSVLAGAVILGGAGRFADRGAMDIVRLRQETVPADSPVVLVTGQSDGACRRNLLIDAADSMAQATAASGGSTLHVGDLSDAGCDSEAAFFARGARALLRVPAWTPDADVVEFGASPPVQLDLNLWVISNRANAHAMELNDLEHAMALFHDNRVGIALRIAHDTLVPRAKGSPASGSAEELIGTSCDNVPTLRASQSSPPVYLDDEINVYFVETVYDEEGGTPRGRTCYTRSSGGAGNVVYISLYRHSPTTLAHELGHVLGLRWNPIEHPDDEGDTQATEEGFTPRNIMWSGLEASQAAARDRFSIGQVYRMSFDTASWVNTQKLRGTDPVKACGLGRVSGHPCPPLGRDLDEAPR